MFDSHSHRYGPESISVRQTITEQRAPTDESVRLLKEMEAEARAKMLASVRLEGNGFAGVVHRWEDVMNDQTGFLVQFKINGEHKEVRHYVERRDSNDKQGIAEELIEKVARVIAADMLGRAFRGVKL